MNQSLVRRVHSLDLVFDPWHWPFARDNAAEIAAHFAEEQARRPATFNGKVFLTRDLGFAGDSLHARCFETDFASFLTWRDLGFPGEGVFNAFGMGALRGSDGVFLMGEMAAHTSNAGRIYFPSGTPDPGDLANGRLDIAGSIVREVEEETGLTPADYEAEREFHCVLATPLIAIIQVLNLKMPAAEARNAIVENLARQRMPEFSAIYLVRDGADIVPAMPRFITAFIEAQAERI